MKITDIPRKYDAIAIVDSSTEISANEFNTIVDQVKENKTNVSSVSEISTELDNKITAQNQNIDSFKEAVTEQISKFTPIIINGNVTNAADEEDITSDSDNLLKLKDRSSLYGLGYVILRRGKTLAAQVTNTKTIYEVRYDFDLDGASVEMPTGCVLKFNGGTISNGSIAFNDTLLDGDISFSGLTPSGTITNKKGEIKWFHQSGDDIMTSLAFLTDNCSTIIINEGTWMADCSSTRALLKSNTNIKGEGEAIIKYPDGVFDKKAGVFVFSNDQIDQTNIVTIYNNNSTSPTTKEFDCTLNNIEISGIKLIVNRKGSTFTEYPYGLAYLMYADNVRVHDCSITDNYEDEKQSHKLVRFDYCKNIEVYNCNVISSLLVYLIGCYNSNVHDNSCYRCSGTWIESSAGVGCYVENNKCTDALAACSIIGVNTVKSRVINNRISNSQHLTPGMITIGHDKDYVESDGTIVSGNELDSSIVETGIIVQKCDGLIIENNIINTIGIGNSGNTSGILINGGTLDNITIKGNIITMDESGEGWNAITETSKTLTQIRIFDNIITGQLNFGHFMSTKYSRCDISKNTIYNCGNTYALSVRENELNITDNYIEGSIIINSKSQEYISDYWARVIISNNTIKMDSLINMDNCVLKRYIMTDNNFLPLTDGRSATLRIASMDASKLSITDLSDFVVRGNKFSYNYFQNELNISNRSGSIFEVYNGTTSKRLSLSQSGSISLGSDYVGTTNYDTSNGLRIWNGSSWDVLKEGVHEYTPVVGSPISTGLKPCLIKVTSNYSGYVAVYFVSGTTIKYVTGTGDGYINSAGIIYISAVAGELIVTKNSETTGTWTIKIQVIS